MIYVFDFENQYFWGNATITNGVTTDVYLARHDGHRKLSIELSMVDGVITANGGYNVDGVAAYIAKHGTIRNGYPVANPRFNVRMFTDYEESVYDGDVDDATGDYINPLVQVSIKSLRLDREGNGKVVFQLIPR